MNTEISKYINEIQKLNKKIKIGRLSITNMDDNYKNKFQIIKFIRNYKKELNKYKYVYMKVYTDYYEEFNKEYESICINCLVSNKKTNLYKFNKNLKNRIITNDEYIKRSKIFIKK